MVLCHELDLMSTWGWMDFIGTSCVRTPTFGNDDWSICWIFSLCSRRQIHFNDKRNPDHIIYVCGLTGVIYITTRSVSQLGFRFSIRVMIIVLLIRNNSGQTGETVLLKSKICHQNLKNENISAALGWKQRCVQVYCCGIDRDIYLTFALHRETPASPPCSLREVRGQVSFKDTWTQPGDVWMSLWWKETKLASVHKWRVHVDSGVGVLTLTC